MMKQLSFLFLSASIFLILFSCTEPTLIGADLLQEDQASFKFRNDIPVDVSTIEGDPVPTYNRFQSLQLEHLLLGAFQDDQFGSSTAGIYTQISRSTGRPDTDITVDSIILSIAYDSLGRYGDLSQPLELEIFRVTETMDPNADYNSDQVFATDLMPVGTATVTPTFDSVQILNYSGDAPVTTMEVPHIRIPLDAAFGELLAADSTVYQSDTTFQEFLKGLYIKPSTSSTGVVSLDFENTISRLTVYYQLNVRSIKSEYRFPFLFGQARINQFIHDYEGSAVANNLNADNTEQVYLQSMGGLNLKVSFPNLADLQNTVINRAELEFTVASNIDSLFPVVEQMIASSSNDIGVRTAIPDVRSAINGSTPINTAVFGGVPVLEDVNGQTLTKYKINISAHFQEIVSNAASNSIIITAGTDEFTYYFPITPKAERANQVILYGTSHPEFAPKLNLTFTSL